MVVALGILADGSMTGETWILDLASSQWRCQYGQGSLCALATPAPPLGPGARSFSCSERIGLYLFVFGGASYDTLALSSGASRRIPSSKGDMWALNLATFSWRPVETSNSPQSRAFSSLVAFDRQAGLKSPVALIGGANLDCYRSGCIYPLPLEEVWVLDASVAENEDRDDNMAEFDGNDFIVVDLPSWCSNVGSMSVLWIDAWINTIGYTTLTENPIVLFDTYYLDSSVLRWCFEGSSDSSSGETTSYITLFLTSSQV